MNNNDYDVLLLNDELPTGDWHQVNKKNIFDTELICTNELGIEVFRKSNKMLIGGALFILQKLFNADTTIDIPRLNTDLSVQTADPAPGFSGVRREHIISLFGVGTDGSGATYGSINPVDFKSKGITIANMVPFRYVPKASDISSALQARYHMKKDHGTHFGYYLKQFEGVPVIKSFFTDGTPVTSTVHSSSKTEAIETYIEISLKVAKEDVREWFIAQGGGIGNSRINTVAFYFGYPVDVSGRTEFQGVKCYSKVNFNNEPLDDDTKELNMLYRIFVG